jgi:type IV secretion system protein VirD4
MLLASPLVVLAVWTMAASMVTLWGLGTMEQVGLPTWQWWGYLITAMPDDGTQQFVDHWLWYGGIAGTLAAASVTYRILSSGRLQISRDSRALFGSAGYATPKQGRKCGLIYSFRPRPDCILLGRTAGFLGLFKRYICLPGPEHAMLYAKTGAGKGVAYVVPNCLNYEDSLVVLDIKRENHTITAAHRENVLGQEVFLFSPLAEDGATHCWNPVGGIDESQSDYLSKIQRRAFNLFPEIGTGSKNKFWVDSARTAWTGIATLICETPGMDLTPAAIFSFFTRSDSVETIARMVEERRATDRPYTQNCINLLSDYLRGNEDMVQGIRKQITSTMGIWFNPRVVAATSKSDFDLRDLRRRKMTIYLGVMPSDLEQLGFLLRLFFLQLFDACMDSHPDHDSTITHRCHVLLDELTAIPPMRSIAKANGFARGFKLHFSFVVQTKTDLRDEYKEDGLASLLGNLGAEIVFRTKDELLAKEVSERVGYNTVENISRTAPRFFGFFRAKEQNESTGQAKRALLLPQEVAELPKDEQIMFREGAPAFRVKRNCWYTDGNFKNLEEDPPPPPTVTYSLDRDDGSVKFGAEKSA